MTTENQENNFEGAALEFVDLFKNNTLKDDTLKDDTFNDNKILYDNIIKTLNIEHIVIININNNNDIEKLCKFINKQKLYKIIDEYKNIKNKL